MILVHIVTNTENQAIEIADSLIEKKLIFDAMIFEKIMIRKRVDGSSFESVKKVLAIGKTKALLFNDIDKLLREKYKDRVPDLYSLPIVNMDWQLAMELVSETTKI